VSEYSDTRDAHVWRIKVRVSVFVLLYYIYIMNELITYIYIYISFHAKKIMDLGVVVSLYTPADMCWSGVC